MLMLTMGLRTGGLTMITYPERSKNVVWVPVQLTLSNCSVPGITEVVVYNRGFDPGFQMNVRKCAKLLMLLHCGQYMSMFLRRGSVTFIIPSKHPIN